MDGRWRREETKLLKSLIIILAKAALLSTSALSAASGQDLARAGAAANGAQAQVGIAFDQIDRVLLRGQVPPPVDSFAADAARIASLPPLKAAKHGGRAAVQTVGNMLLGAAMNFVPLGGIIGGIASRAANAAEEAAERHYWEEHNAALMRFISAGTITHFALYHGWSRSEQKHEVTILKPEEGLSFILDTEKRTAQVIDLRTAPETIEVDTAATLPPALVGEPETTPLPEMTIGGLPARGYRTNATIELHNAIGWCAAGRHIVTQVEYIVDMPDPQPPATEVAARGLGDGCQPASTVSYREPGRFVLYRATSTDPDTPKAITMMFERGNIRPLNQKDASLFSVPPAFTKEQ